MKVFIVFCSILIISVTGLLFVSDFERVELVEKQLKQDANNIASGVISFIDPVEYSEGKYVVDDDSALDFIADYTTSGSQRALDAFTLYIFDDSMFYRVYDNVTPIPTPVPFAYSTPVDKHYVSIDGQDVEITEPTVFVKLNTTGDYYRLSFLNKNSVFRAATYVADSRSGSSDVEEEEGGDVEQGLLGHYTFSSNLNDFTSNMLDGTAVGTISYDAGVNGFGAVFDGVSSAVDVGNVFNIGLSDYSFSCWVKTGERTASDGDQYIISKGRISTAPGSYSIGVSGGEDGGTIFARLTWDSGEALYTGNKHVDDDAWHHIVCTFDRDEKLTIYVDGIVDTAYVIVDKCDVPITSSDPFIFGAITAVDGIGCESFYDGILDNARVYGKALSYPEIVVLYGEKHPAMLAWYPLGASAEDASGNDLDGLLAGPTPIAGLVGLASSFDGVDDHVVIPTFTFEVNQTITAVVDFSEVDTLQCFLGGAGGYGIRYDGLEFSVFTGNALFETVPWLSPDTPVLFSVTRESLGNYTFYINGNSVGTANSANEQNIVLGLLGKGSDGQCFKGIMQNVRFYNKALTISEIRELYESLFTFVEDGLSLHYTFSDFAQPATNEFAKPTFDTPTANGGWNHWGSVGHAGSFGQNTDSDFVYGYQTYSHWVSNSEVATKSYLLYQYPPFDGGIRSLQAVVCMSDKSPVTNDKVYPAWNSIDGGIPNNQWTSIERIGATHFYLCKAEGISQNGENDLIGIYTTPGNKAYFSRVQSEQNDHCTPFINGTRLGTVIDKSGSDNHIALTEQNSPVWVGNSSTGEGYYVFDGVKQSISLPIEPPSEFTISFWFYKDSFGTDSWESLFGGPSALIGIQSKANTVNIPVLTLTGRSSAQIPYAVNQWNHVVFTRSESESKLYLNGNLSITSISGSVPLGEYFIGSSVDNYTQNFKGRIDDFRIYNRVFSDAEATLLTPAGRK